jgi:hypothetical protein
MCPDQLPSVNGWINLKRLGLLSLVAAVGGPSNTQGATTNVVVVGVFPNYVFNPKVITAPLPAAKGKPFNERPPT